MALVVEDGSGLATSNAFVSLAQADTYFLVRANAAWAVKPDTEREAAIVRATAYMSNAFDWEGTRVKGRAQALAWPRNGVTDEDDIAVPNDQVPWEVEDATCEVAVVEVITPGAMSPAVSMGDRITQETVGAISVSYELGVNAYQNIPSMPIVDNLIGAFLGSGYGVSSMFGKMERV